MASPAPWLHVLDFEGHPSYGVIEYGVVSLWQGEIVQVATRICAPRGAIPEADARLHGLRAAETAQAAPFAEDYERFLAYRQQGLFVAHNQVVEHRLLRETWPYPSLVPDWSPAGQPVAAWGPYLDTLVLARRQWPQLLSHALGDLVAALDLLRPLSALVAEYCPAGRQRPHCALYDALACTLVLQQLAALNSCSTDPQRLLPLMRPPQQTEWAL